MSEELRIIQESSAYLATLLRRPENEDWLWQQKNLFRRYPLTELYEDVQATAGSCDSFEALQRAFRYFKQRHFLRIGGRDLLGRADLQETTGQLSDLAAVTLQAGLASLWRHPEWWLRDLDAASVARVEGDLSLAILGLGKLGGHELNYVSDVDLLFLHAPREPATERLEEAPEVLTRLCQWLSRLMAESVEGDRVFLVDLRLRPQGKDGALVPSLAAAADHYLLHGHAWERQMLLKARPVAGDRSLGTAFLREVRPFVFRRFLDFQSLDELRAMRDRILREAGRPHAGWQQFDVKLGVGGIREIEFLVQSFQMVYGGRHPELDEPNTLRCLDHLERLALLPRETVIELWDAYIFLRRVEHWVQLDQNRQTQKLPQSEEGFSRLALALGLEGDTNRFLEELREVCSVVHGHFTKLFETDGRVSGDASAGSTVPDQVESEHQEDLLKTLSELFPPEPWERLLAALAHYSPRVGEAVLEVLRPYREISGRKREHLERVPVRLERYFTQARRRPGLFKLLNASHTWIAGLCQGLAQSELVSDLLGRQPGLVEGIVAAEDIILQPEQWQSASEKILASLGDFETALEWIRRLKNERLLQIALADLQGSLDQEQVEGALAELAEFVIRHTYLWVREDRGLPAGLPLAVVALGKLGSQGMNYLSDLDLVFVYHAPEVEDSSQIPMEVVRFIQRLMRMLSTPLQEGPGYAVDVRLRPTGNVGPLVVTRASWEHYYTREADIWEIQALLRARTVAGPEELRQWLDRRAQQICYQKRDAATVWPRLCHLRQRMQLERSEERADLVDLKLGMGGLADVEFLVQAHQLLFGEQLQGLRIRSVRTALERLGQRVEGVEGGGLPFREVWLPFQGLRALEQRLQLATNLSGATVTPEQLESMMVLGVWPRAQGDYGIYGWEALLAARRKVRQVLRHWCTNL
jgi:[glutamine synthetase] adenylyltransferase / [glutamine synthetase]-adenylyl-L-tyrosine phosphorylase